MDANTVFKSFPFARYATDVTFQQAFRPSGSLDEAKKYFSGKHKLYGYKVELSVLPNGLAISCSTHYPGSVFDLEIFQDMRSVHKRLLKKSGEECELQDFGLLRERYPKLWGVLLDKGTKDVWNSPVPFCLKRSLRTEWSRLQKKPIIGRS